MINAGSLTDIEIEWMVHQDVKWDCTFSSSVIEIYIRSIVTFKLLQNLWVHWNFVEIVSKIITDHAVMTD